MHKKINIVIWSIALLLAIIIVFMCFFSSKVKLYEKKFHYFNTDIIVRIYEDEPDRVEKVWNKVQSIYEEYEKLSNIHQSYDDTLNLHTIRYNKQSGDVLTIPSKLYKMLEYSNDFVQRSNGAFQITNGTVMDGWAHYLKNKKKVPTKKEIEKWEQEDQASLVLLGENQIQNTHPMIELGKIPLGFANDEIIDYLKEEEISQYLIQEGGNATTGLSFNDQSYKVALEILNQNDVATIVHLKNRTIVTNVSDIEKYEYDGESYHLLIDPNTSYPAKKIDKVTVIAKDSKTAYTLSTVLYMMDVEQGKKMVEEFQNVDVLWLDLNGKQSATKGFSQYES